MAKLADAIHFDYIEELCEEILDRLKELIPMIRPNLEKFDKSKYPAYDYGVFPKMKLPSNHKINTFTGKFIDDNKE